MYASVGESHFASGELLNNHQLEQTKQAIARQPGYRGVLIINAGSGRGLTITLWDSPADREAAVASDEVRRVLADVDPGRTAPRQIIAEGTVLVSDFIA